MACVVSHMSIPSGTGVDPVDLLSGSGCGNWNVRAIPASVANPMNGIVKMSMPNDICRIM